MTRFYKRIIYTFYITGQSVHNPYLNDIHESSAILQYIPVFLLFCLTCCSGALVLFYQTYFAIDYGKTDTIVAYLFLLSDLIANLAMMVQKVVYNNNMRNIYHKYLYLDLFLRQKLNIRLNFQKYCKRFIRKVFIVLLVFMAMVVAKCFVRTNESDFILSQGYCLLRFLAILGKLHACFFIYLARNIFKSIFDQTDDTFLIKQQARQFGQDDLLKIIDNLKHFKIVHLKLYDIVMDINQVFGWGLLALCLEFFVDVSYSLYWIFCHFQTNSCQYATCLRKYNIFYINNLIILIAELFR